MDEYLVSAVLAVFEGAQMVVRMKGDFEAFDVKVGLRPGRYPKISEILKVVLKFTPCPELFCRFPEIFEKENIAMSTVRKHLYQLQRVKRPLMALNSL